MVVDNAVDVWRTVFLRPETTSDAAALRCASRGSRSLVDEGQRVLAPKALRCDAIALR